MRDGEDAGADRAPVERVAAALHDATRVELLEQLAEIRAIAGLLAVRALAIVDDDAREQTGYLARQLQRHVGDGLALLEGSPRDRPRD